MNNRLTLIIAILWFVFFAKQMLFWLWLWQLKEYHWGRFKAHFETQTAKKILASFWRLKWPKMTKKMTVIVAYSLLLELGILGRLLRLNNEMFLGGLAVTILLALILASLSVLLFEIPTGALRNKLMEKARQKRSQFPNLTVVGITGSYGKTSVKEFLCAVLSEKFRVLKTPSHINAEIGIAKTILGELTSEHQIFVAEIGAYERGKISEVCWLLQPKIGILTGINEQHMSTFGSQENIVKGKFELIEALPADGAAILNTDSGLIKNEKLKIKNDNPKLKIVDCSTKTGADVWPENVRVGREKVSFVAMTKDGERTDFEVKIAGEQNIINILMAIACAKELGMRLDEIAAACRKIKPEQGSVQIEQGIAGLIILDSTYSANPDGVLADLEYLKLWPNKKIIIMPCLIELGSSAKQVHRQIGQSIDRVCDLAIITTKDYFQEIKNGSGKAILLEKTKDILEKIKTFARPGDTILLESRVPKLVIDQLLCASRK